MEQFLWPLKRSSVKISQHFGSIWSANSSKKHTGIDIAAVPGDAVYAAAAGMVTKTGILDTTGAWAKYVVLEHETKDYCTSYLHIEPKVAIGQKLNVGDFVGVIADISAPHCHFNVWKSVHDDKLTQRGALPIVCAAGGDPVFPNNFVDPLSFSYRYVDSDTIPPTPIVPLFIRNLVLNDSGTDVSLLQILLNKDPETTVATTGPGSPGRETNYFGDLTEKAVQKFQVKYGIVSLGAPGYGLVGSLTRTKLQELFGNHLNT
ncbi:MAG: peptidoglycan DD-metalloendopeptidase family protein [bacterium]|nr:peptidoglycan DD-metalloendopeptidase family protein [bacterium]